MKNSKHLNIAMVVFSYYPSDPRVRREAESLQRAGHSIDILCLRGKDEKKNEKYGSIETIRIMSGTENKERIIKYILLTTFFFISAIIKLNYLFIKKKYDLLHIHNMPDHLVFVGILFKVFNKKPIILDLHDLTPELFSSKWGNSNKKLLLPIVNLVEKISCKFADHIITTSYGFKEKLVERNIKQEKIAIILNSADENIFTLSKERSFKKNITCPSLIYHGTVAKRFGIHVAIESVGKLKSHIPEIKFNVYGKYDPSYRLELEEMVRSLKLSNNIFLNGYLSLEKIVKIIENSDIGIVPYLSDPFMDLALSTKTFEYVLMNLPTVASELPSLKTLFSNKSIKYFKSGDADDLAEKILETCINPNIQQQFVENAMEEYKKISWANMEKTYFDVIGKLIA